MKHHKTGEKKHKEHHVARQKHKISGGHSEISGNTEKVLVENFVALQKVMAELARNFDSLSSRITKLLDLFELSAKTLAEKDFEAGRDLKFEKDISQKIDNLVEHNKLFARGLSLLHEKTGGEQEIEQRQVQGSAMPQMQKRIEVGDNYQKSISSKP